MKIKHINAHMWNVCYIETKEVVIITTYINANKFCSYRKKNDTSDFWIREELARKKLLCVVTSWGKLNGD